MPNIGAPELIIIAVALIVLFGATKLPTFARSIGRSMRIFKSEVKGLQKDDDGEAKATEEEPAEEQKKPELTENQKPDPSAAQSTPQSTQSQQSAEQR